MTLIQHEILLNYRESRRKIFWATQVLIQKYYKLRYEWFKDLNLENILNVKRRIIVFLKRLRSNKQYIRKITFIIN